MTFSYVAFPACSGRLPLSGDRVSGVCIERPISSNNVGCTHFLPLMRRTELLTVSLVARCVSSDVSRHECLFAASVCAVVRNGWLDVEPVFQGESPPCLWEWRSRPDTECR